MEPSFASIHQTPLYEMIFDFSDPANGAHPSGSFVQGADGRLYGLTSQGGIQAMGQFFALIRRL
jgi:hypothetical protein